MSVLVDTSFIVSLINPQEKQHSACVQVARNLRQGLLLPVTVLPEVTYLLARHISHQTMRQFINRLRDPQWQIENLLKADIHRAHQLLEQYRDTALDFTDATIVAIGERLDVRVVLTLDQRDFRMIRPKHTDYFTILPQPAWPVEAATA